MRQNSFSSTSSRHSTELMSLSRTSSKRSFATHWIDSSPNTFANAIRNKHRVLHVHQFFTHKTARVQLVQSRSLSRSCGPSRLEHPDVQLVSGRCLRVSNNQSTPIVKYPVSRLDASRIRTVHNPRQAGHGTTRPPQFYSLTSNYAETMTSTNRHAPPSHLSSLFSPLTRRMPLPRHTTRDPRPAVLNTTPVHGLRAVRPIEACGASPRRRKRTDRDTRLTNPARAPGQPPRHRNSYAEAQQGVPMVPG